MASHHVQAFGCAIIICICITCNHSHWPLQPSSTSKESQSLAGPFRQTFRFLYGFCLVCCLQFRIVSFFWHFGANVPFTLSPRSPESDFIGREESERGNCRKIETAAGRQEREIRDSPVYFPSGSLTGKRTNCLLANWDSEIRVPFLRRAIGVSFVLFSLHSPQKIISVVETLHEVDCHLARQMSCLSLSSPLRFAF